MWTFEKCNDGCLYDRLSKNLNHPQKKSPWQETQPTLHSIPTSKKICKTLEIISKYSFLEKISERQYLRKSFNNTCNKTQKNLNPPGKFLSIWKHFDHLENISRNMSLFLWHPALGIFLRKLSYIWFKIQSIGLLSIFSYNLTLPMNVCQKALLAFVTLL